MKRRFKIFIMGLDGADWNVLEQLMAENSMPFLKKLLKESSYGILNSTIPPVTAPAWTAFQTGVNSAKSGIYDFFQYDPVQKKAFLSNSNSIKVKTLWELVSRAGKKVISINVPMTYPPKKVNGIIISGMMSPKVSPEFVYPKEIFYEVFRKVKNYNITLSKHWLKVWGIEKYILKLIEIEKKRMEIAYYLMEKYDWDLCMVQNQSLDSIQHTFYQYMDKNSPLFSKKIFMKVRKFYEFIDAQISEVIKKINKNAVLVILSDHGFCSLNTGVNFNLWLKKCGYLNLKSDIRTKMFYVEEVINRLPFLKRTVESFLNKKLDNFMFKVLMRAKSIYTSIDWSNTKAFMAGGVPYASIYINAKDKSKVILKLIDNIENFRDPQTGERIVEKIYKKEDIFNGPFIELAPELILKPTKGYSFFPYTSLSNIFMRRKTLKEITGTHRQEGIFVIRGPNVKSGYKTIASILDMFPTILAILGVEIPEYIDGKVLKDIFKDEIEIKISKDKKCLSKYASYTYSKKEEEEIKNRLQDLGYI